MASKIIPIKPVSAWSFSRYQDYSQCPRLFKFKHVDRMKEPESPPMMRGSAIHKMAEAYIRGDLPKLPPELKLFKDELKTLRDMYKRKASSMVVEDNWAFTKEWDETSWNDWANCWVRIKLDCAHHEAQDVLVVTDWKTGKFRAEMNENYVEQLELYALAAMLLHPHIKTVKPRLCYTDEGRTYPTDTDKQGVRPVKLEYVRDDIPQLKKTWAKRVKAMMSDTAYAPRPNDKCRWCWFGQSGKGKGGPGLCEY